jgi:hypothetical protein
LPAFPLFKYAAAQRVSESLSLVPRFRKIARQFFPLSNACRDVVHAMRLKLMNYIELRLKSFHPVDR